MKFIFLKTFLMLFVFLSVLIFTNSAKLKSNEKEDKCKNLIQFSYGSYRK